MTWQQLKDIIDENRKAAEEEALRPITKCPECDYPHLAQNKEQILSCPICGWKGGR